MKENKKAFQDKKVPMDATTEKNKTKSSNKEANQNDATENVAKDTFNKTTKTTGKFDSEKGKPSTAR